MSNGRNLTTLEFATKIDKEYVYSLNCTWRAYTISCSRRGKLKFQFPKSVNDAAEDFYDKGWRYARIEGKRYRLCPQCVRFLKTKSFPYTIE